MFFLFRLKVVLLGLELGIRLIRKMEGLLFIFLVFLVFVVVILKIVRLFFGILMVFS